MNASPINDGRGNSRPQHSGMQSTRRFGSRSPPKNCGRSRSPGPDEQEIFIAATGFATRPTFAVGWRASCGRRSDSWCELATQNTPTVNQAPSIVLVRTWPATVRVALKGNACGFVHRPGPLYAWGGTAPPPLATPTHFDDGLVGLARLIDVDDPVKVAPLPVVLTGGPDW